MLYSFDTDQAEKYGVDAAIMINNFQFWINHNAANGKNAHAWTEDFKIGNETVKADNEIRHWCFNSARAFTVLFPFWKEGQIKRILKHLVQEGVLIKGSFNQKKYDRTMWYAFKNEAEYITIKREQAKTDQTIGQNQPDHRPKSTNGKDEINRPIPDSKPYSKQYSKPDKTDAGKIKSSNEQFRENGEFSKEKTFTYINQHKKQVNIDELSNYLFQNKFRIDGQLIDIAGKIDEMHEQSLRAYNEAPVVSVEESNKQFQDSSGSFNKQLIIDYVKNKNMHKVLTADFINEWFNKYSETGFTRDGIIFDISFALDSCFIALKRKLKEEA